MLRVAQSKLDWSSKTSLICAVAGDGFASKRARQSDMGFSQRSTSPVRSSNATHANAANPANRPAAAFLFIERPESYIPRIAASKRRWRSGWVSLVEAIPRRRNWAMRSPGGGCVAAKSSRVGFQIFSMFSSIATRAPGG